MARNKSRVGKPQGYLVIQAFDKFAKALDGASEAVVEDATRAVFETSQELVPVDTGALKSSGRIEWDVNRRNKFDRKTGIVSYGGPSITTKSAPHGMVEYAAAVHAQNPWLLNAVTANLSLIRGLVRQRFSLSGLERYGFKRTK